MQVALASQVNWSANQDLNKKRNSLLINVLMDLCEIFDGKWTIESNRFLMQRVGVATIHHPPLGDHHRLRPHHIFAISVLNEFEASEFSMTEQT